jgi:ATP-dependent RNA helicase RhlB
MRFDELQLDERTMLGIADAGFTECTPVQAATLVHSLAGRDICAQSQTGTGKTAVFLLTIFQRLKGVQGKKAMIIVPTRELAVQVEREAELLGAHLDYRTACIYGGVGYKSQEQQLKQGANIIVGTPAGSSTFTARASSDSGISPSWSSTRRTASSTWAS